MQTRFHALVRCVLDVDVDARAGPGAEDVGQERDGLGAADAGPGHLGVGEPGDLPGPVGHPAQGPVVEGDQDAVGGGVHVGLQIPVAEVDRPLEGRQGVLRKALGAAPVGERDGTRMIKEFVGTRHT